MRTLSEAAVYKLPDFPKHKAVIGFSPFCIRPGFTFPVHSDPEELK